MCWTPLSACFHLLALIWLTERNEERCLSALNPVTRCDVICYDPPECVYLCVLSVCVLCFSFMFMYFYVSFRCSLALAALCNLGCLSVLCVADVGGCHSSPNHPNASGALSSGFIGACRVPETPVCSVIRGLGGGLLPCHWLASARRGGSSQSPAASCGVCLCLFHFFFFSSP